MNSDQFARWLTIGANIGVVVGIIFLAIELHQNSELLESQASITYAQARTDSLNNQIQNENLLETLVKARDGGSLSPLELARLEIYYRAIFVMWDWEYNQYADGLLFVTDEPPAKRWKSSINYYPHMRESWEVHKPTYSSNFVQYMEDDVLGQRD